MVSNALKPSQNEQKSPLDREMILHLWPEVVKPSQSSGVWSDRCSKQEFIPPNPDFVGSSTSDKTQIRINFENKPFD